MPNRLHQLHLRQRVPVRPRQPPPITNPPGPIQWRLLQRLAQCRGDLSPANCSDCLSRSVTEIIARCPWRKQAVLRFDGCLMRYSDKRFFSTLSTDGSQMLYNVNNASDQKLLNRQLGRLLNGLSTNASLDSSRFAEGEINYTTDVGKLYGLVQCTKDLSEGDCLSCLTQSIADLPGCCSGKIGARVISLSCYLRESSQMGGK
ncbi:Cysteine-rich repeat secretory protein 38 [Acorus calamus]|uniref:Cysteine-rich repeat secretory protein 38 n=1 Tax=Acorus calamus TaxID=4465 RepID=A0AAV9DJQ0_ACOCL|nr:Cysteine-rich repeat secretory protein 38 [Acorus calamus]